MVYLFVRVISSTDDINSTVISLEMLDSSTCEFNAEQMSCAQLAEAAPSLAIRAIKALHRKRAEVLGGVTEPSEGAHPDAVHHSESDTHRKQTFAAFVVTSEKSSAGSSSTWQDTPAPQRQLPALQRVPNVIAEEEEEQVQQQPHLHHHDHTVSDVSRRH